MERAILDQDGRDRAAPSIELRLEHGAGGVPLGVRLELADVGHEQDHFQEQVEVLALLRRHLDHNRLTAPFFGNEIRIRELALDSLGVDAGLVDLVHGHDDRHVRRARVVDGLARLRHHTVVGSHDQHHDVGHLCAAGAHQGEGFVTGRIEEDDVPVVDLDVIGPDVLGDATSLALRHARFPDRVEQGRLAVVDVTHDGDHRGARHHVIDVDVFGLDLQHLFFEAPHLDVRAELAGEHRRVLGVERRVDGHHQPLVQEFLEHVLHAHFELVRQVLHRHAFDQGDGPRDGGRRRGHLGHPRRFPAVAVAAARHGRSHRWREGSRAGAILAYAASRPGRCRRLRADGRCRQRPRSPGRRRPHRWRRGCTAALASRVEPVRQPDGYPSSAAAGRLRAAAPAAPRRPVDRLPGGGATLGRGRTGGAFIGARGGDEGALPGAVGSSILSRILGGTSRPGVGTGGGGRRGRRRSRFLNGQFGRRLHDRDRALDNLLGRHVRFGDRRCRPDRLDEARWRERRRGRLGRLRLLGRGDGLLALDGRPLGEHVAARQRDAALAREAFHELATHHLFDGARRALQFDAMIALEQRQHFLARRVEQFRDSIDTDSGQRYSLTSASDSGDLARGFPTRRGEDALGGLLADPGDLRQRFHGRFGEPLHRGIPRIEKLLHRLVAHARDRESGGFAGGRFDSLAVGWRGPVLPGPRTALRPRVAFLLRS